MLLGKAFGYPDDRDCLEPGGIGDHLAQVGVVCPLQLILDQDPIVVGQVFAQNVGPERTHCLFQGLKFELQANGVAQQLQIAFLGQPRGKASRFRHPNFAKAHLLQSAKIFAVHAMIENVVVMLPHEQARYWINCRSIGQLENGEISPTCRLLIQSMKFSATFISLSIAATPSSGR